MKFVYLAGCCLFVISFANKVYAATCSAVFPEVVSSYSNAGVINFAKDSTLFDTDGIIDISIGVDASVDSCDSTLCVSSGNTSAALTLPAFNYTNSSQDVSTAIGGSYFLNQGSYDDLILEQNASLLFYDNNTDTRFDTISLLLNSTLTLTGGVYWFNDLTMAENAKIEVEVGERAIVYVNTFTLAKNLLFNMNGDEDQLTIIAMNNMSLSDDTDMRGFLYVNETLNWAKEGFFYGAINAKNISIGDNGNFYTRVAGVNTAEFDGTCDQTQTIPSPIIYYSMDMCSAPSGSNAINDEIGTADADANGSISVSYTGKHCQAAYLSGDQSFIDVPDPASAGLAEGSISVYFNTSDLTHSNYASAGSMALFSRDASGTETGGHLTVWVSDSGAISVRHQSSTSSYSLSTNSGLIQENQWHHLVYTWGSSGMNIYIDSVRRGQYTSYTGGFTANGVDMAIGANAWQYQAGSNTPRTNQLRDFFKGSIDELKIFDEQLSESQVTTLAALASQDCVNCSTDPVLVAHWGGDACSLAQNEIVETVAGLNATAQNGVAIETSSRFCQGLSFSGNQSYATVSHDSQLLVAAGAISLWFKIPDLSHSDDNAAGGNGLIAKDKVNYSNGGHLELRVDADGKIQVRHQSTSVSTSFGTAAVVQENQWHHLVYSFGPMGVQVYVDNVLEYSDINYTNSIATNDETLVFGATARYANRHETTASNFNDFLKGEMDQIKIFENQPSASDVADWYLEAPSACTICNSLVAEYTFDQTNTVTSVIEDSSGNNNNGTLGASLSTAVINDNVSCRALLTLDIADTGAQYYFDSGVDANDIGNQGSISFWYRAKNVWNDAVARQLFDATDASNSKYFFLSKQGDGSLVFGFEDTADADLVISTNAQTYVADTWVHISVQWNIVTSQYSIYLDGQAQQISIDGELPSSSTLGNMTSLVFGDNKSTYNVNGASTIPSNGYIDEIRIYSQAISASQISDDMLAAQPCATVDHYLIEHPVSALTCDSPEVVVKACADVDCTTLSSLPSSITLTPDKFTTSSSVTFTGQVTLILDNQDIGILTLGSSSQDPIATVECDNNCEVDFETVGVQFFNRITGQSNFNTTQFLAQDNLDLVGIRVVGATNGGICEGLVDGETDISLTYECVTTASVDYTPTSCNVPFAGIALSSNNSHTGTISLTFDANGESDLGAYNFADAGILRLTASAVINNVNVQPATSDLRIVPANLLLAASNNAVNTAGVPLSLTITAQGVSGATLPGFQSNDLQLSAQRLIPNDVSGFDSQFYIQTNTSVYTSLNTQFSSIAMTFTNGITSTNTAYMEEVGTYTIDLQDNDYLGATILANSITLGRFIPAYFDVQKSHQPTLQNTCGTSFTYVGEDFSYASGLEPSVLVTAYNALGQVTRNYTDSLWTLNPTALALANQQLLVDGSSYSGALAQSTDLSSISVSGTDVYDGMATFVANGISYNYAKVTTPTGADASPFVAQFDYTLNQAWFTDADNVCYQSSYPNGCDNFTINDISGADMRYGRLNIENAFGPENEALSIPLYTEYLDAGQWRVNTQDNCTALSLTQAAGNIVVTHDQQSTVNLASMVTSTTINTTLTSGIAPYDAIELGPYLIASEAQSGSFYIELVPSTVPNHWSDYLNFDWNDDGLINADDQPAANINFGIYKSNERTLHWREVLN